MQTLNLTITLPDSIQFDDRDALRMQVLFVKNLVDSGRINFYDPAQRDAVLDWYLQIVPHIQPTAAEGEGAKAVFRQQYGLPETSGKSAVALVQEIDAEMDRLSLENNWTAATFEQWGTEHLRASHRPA